MSYIQGNKLYAIFFLVVLFQGLCKSIIGCKYVFNKETFNESDFKYPKHILTLFSVLFACYSIIIWSFIIRKYREFDSVMSFIKPVITLTTVAIAVMVTYGRHIHLQQSQFGGWFRLKRSV